jgi:deoxyribodipyrimidine photo-lyase
MPADAALVWFRRDLRDYDHAALYHALKAHPRVFCAFCFDTEILDPLPSRADRRVEFIFRSVAELDRSLRGRGGGMIVVHGRARAEVPRLAARLGVAAVYANHDYEPQAIDRDA